MVPTLTLILLFLLMINRNVFGDEPNKDESQAGVKDAILEIPADFNLTRIQILEEKSGSSNECTFRIVEYDSLEYLDYLSGRMKNQPSTNAETTSGTARKVPQYTPTTLTGHGLPEQYGIFDRLTRLRTSTTTVRPHRDYLGDFNVLSLNVDDFNSEECGLRTYETGLDISSPISYEEALAEDHIEDQSGGKVSGQHKLIISPPPPKVRQRLTHNELERTKSQLESLTKLMRQREEQLKKNKTTGGGDGDAGDLRRPSNDLDDIFNRFSEDPPKSDQSKLDRFTLSGPDAEYKRDQTQPNLQNLEAKRKWLQQQLSQTLRQLGYNSTVQESPADPEHTHIRDQNDMHLARMAPGLPHESINLVPKNQELSDRSASKVQMVKRDVVIAAGEHEAARNEHTASEAQGDHALEARLMAKSKLSDSPWSVSLQALVSKPGSSSGVEYRHFCNGAIISEYYVLTAAHCLDFMVGRESRLFVAFGDTDWRLSSNAVSGRRVAIDKLIIHIGYKSTAFGHDIGLIKTRERMRPIKAAGRYLVNSVCLPQRGSEHSGEAELAGWSQMSDFLQAASVPILPRSLCMDLYGRRTGLIQWLIGIELITDKQLCAGTFDRGICQGDSGSALVVNNKPTTPDKQDLNVIINQDFNRGDSWTKRLILKQERDSRRLTRATIIGTVAFGGTRKCSYESLPGVYMQTSKYLDWILPRIREFTRYE